MLDDLDLDGDDIYFVDSSYKHNLNEVVQEVVRASFPGGRFLFFFFILS
jgi:SAM-dependent methyltransferase